MNTRFVAIIPVMLMLVFAGVGCWKPSVDSQNPRISGRDDVLEDWGIRGQQYDLPAELDGRTLVCLDAECLDVPGLTYPVDELTETEREVMLKALDDEYRSLAVHQAIIRRHGFVRPFAMIIRSEERHVVALEGVFDKYGLEVPDNEYTGNIQARETVKGACEFGVGMVEESIRLMKEEFMPVMIGRKDVSRVFGTLLNASEDKYLPALRDCAQ